MVGDLVSGHQLRRSSYSRKRTSPAAAPGGPETALEVYRAPLVKYPMINLFHLQEWVANNTLVRGVQSATRKYVIINNK